MSVVKVQGNASGTGIFTIAAPATNTDRTLTLPDQTGTVLTNAGPFTANASASAGAVTIDASNNVGIGTSSPGAKLHVYGDAATVRMQDDGGLYAQVSTDNSGNLYLEADVTNGATSSIRFVNDATERARIDSSGNLLIGTTTSSGNNGIVAAGVYNNTTASGANVQVDNTGPGLLRRSTSSIQYKTQVENIAPEFIDNVLKFRPVWYRSLCEGDRKDWSWYGLIAEEVAELDPRLVHWRQYDTSVDADGGTVQTKLDQPVAEGVMYDRVVVLALAKIQEQQATIESLTARIVALEAK